MPAKVKTPSMVVRKKAGPAKPKLGRFMLRVGTPHEPGDVVRYIQRGTCKKAAREAFAAWVPWCERYNNAGVEPLTDVIAKVDAHIITTDPETFSCCFDEHTGMTVVVEVWEAAA